MCLCVYACADVSMSLPACMCVYIGVFFEGGGGGGLFGGMGCGGMGEMVRRRDAHACVCVCMNK